MPAGSVFVDTNVLLYSRQTNTDHKSERASTWLRELAVHQKGRTNLQVLNELTNALFRKRADLTASEIFVAVDHLLPFGSSLLNADIVASARWLKIRYHYSWWDCLLLASAIELDCTHFLSEDLQDGQVVEDSGGKTLTIVSPFAHSPEQFFSSP